MKQYLVVTGLRLFWVMNSPPYRSTAEKMINIKFYQITARDDLMITINSLTNAISTSKK